MACVTLLAGCAGAAPAASLPGETPAPSGPSGAVSALATVFPDIPLAWRTYTEAALGYSLSFPQDTEFTSGTSKAGVYTARLQFRVPGADGYQGMVLRVEPNPQGKGIEQIAKEFYQRGLLQEPPAHWMQQLGGVTVAGLSGVQLGQGADISLIIPYADRVYIIAPVHDTVTTALDPKALELFFQVLATLKVPR